MSWNISRVMTDIESLSVPRRAGSAGEKKAIEYLVNSLQEIGIPHTLEEFSFSLFPAAVGVRFVLLILWVVLLAAVDIHESHPVTSTVLFVFLLAGSIPGTRWNNFVERIFDFRVMRKKSANVVARLSPEETKGRLVLMAHHDSKAQTFPLYIRFILYAAFFTGLAGVSVLYFLFRIFGATDWILYLWIPSMLLAIPMFLLLFNFSSDRSPGSVDNATGLAVLLELARELKERGLKRIETVFVMTGAEEEGFAGAIRFIQEKVSDYNKHNTYFLNFDGLGSPGGLILFSRHGVPPVRTGERLEMLLVDCANEMNIPLHPGYLPANPCLDHIPVSHKGYRAATLTSSGMSRATMSIHTPWDSVENVDPERLRESFLLVSNLVDVLEKGVSN